MSRLAFFSILINLTLTLNTIASETFSDKLASLKKEFEVSSSQIQILRNEAALLAIDWNVLQEELYAKRIQWDQLYSQLMWLNNQRFQVMQTPAMNPQHLMYLRNTVAGIDVSIQQIHFQLNQLWQMRPQYAQNEFEIRRRVANNQTSLFQLNGRLSNIQMEMNNVKPLAEKEQERAQLQTDIGKVEKLIASTKSHEVELKSLQDKISESLSDFDKFWEKKESEYNSINGI